MVLPTELQRHAPGVHQQATPGATTEVGLGGIAPAHQARLGVLADALAHLAKKGLMAAAVIANFHRQRVIPLMERALPIFKLTPGTQASGSRTAVELLPHNTAAWRARYAVAEFPNDPEDL